MNDAKGLMAGKRRGPPLARGGVTILQSGLVLNFRTGIDVA